MEDIRLPKPPFTHFVNYCLLRGGHIQPTGFKDYNSMWPAYCNPSIFYDEKNNRFLMIQRNVSYVLNGSKGKLWNSWGPLHYSIPQERYDWLETRNFLGKTDDPMASDWGFKEIQMKPRTQMWSFRGLEDARCVRWNGKLYAIGVRRDDNTTGVGRMEIVELDKQGNEVRAVKMKGPGDDKQYCIKNVVPVTDMPGWFVYQAANPVILIGVNLETGDITSMKEVETDVEVFKGFDMPRGSSHCIPWGDGNHHLSCVHLCTMYYTGNKRKYARYLHAFVEYDENWNVCRTSQLFAFDDLLVEFMLGMTMKHNMVYLSFALQDNISYVLEVNMDIIDKFLDTHADHDLNQSYTVWDKVPPQKQLYEYAGRLFTIGDYAGAFTWFTKAIDLFDYTYEERFMAARCVANLGHRDITEIGMWFDVIEHDPTRPEGYCAIANYYFCRGANAEAWYWIKKAMEKMVSKLPTIWYTADDIRLAYKQISRQTSHYNEVDSTLQAVKAF